MSIKLEKNGTINLKKAAPSMKNVTVGLGWDPVKGGKAIDCDAAVAIIKKGQSGGFKLFGDSSKKEVIYFGHKKSADGSILHSGDNLTGDGDGDDEQIRIDFGRVDTSTEKIYIGVNIYSAASRHQDFSKIENCFIRLVDNDTNIEVCRYDISNNKAYDGCVSMIMGVLEREADGFKFTALGDGQRGTNVTSMFNECN